MGETMGNAESQREKKKRLILVVDSDAAHLYYTGMLLQRLDYNIHTVKTAEDALEVMEVVLPALVLTESVLPGVNGLELLKRIKRNPRTTGVPVIVYSQTLNQSLKDACLREGCAAYLQKPIVPDVLYAIIQETTETRPRRYIRFSTCLKLTVGEEAEDRGSPADNCITAISENGVYVNTSTPRKIGTHVPITIFLGASRIRVEGHVLYSFKLNEGPLREPGMGIKFLHIKPDDQAFIREFIRKELTQELSHGR